MGGSTTNGAALVTGAAGGIGREIVARLVARCTSVAAVDCSPGVASLADLGTPSAVVVPIVADLRNATACLGAAEDALDALGEVTILINAAGVMRFKPLAEHTVTDWDEQMDLNARASFLMCQAIVPQMAARGTGVVVNIASIWGHRGGPNRAAYVATKHAVIGLTRALAAEFGPAVRINSISPGPTDTPMTAMLDVDRSQWMQPGEVADAVDYLCSPAASGIVGTDLQVIGRGRPAGFTT